VIGKHM